MQEHREMREQAAGNSGKHRADHERHHLEPRRVDAHRFGGDLVVANRDERAAIAGVHQVVNGDDGDQHKQVDPEEIAELRNSQKTRATPPTASMFRMRTRMISPNPSVTMAR